jgi:hypothetical protein
MSNKDVIISASREGTASSPTLRGPQTEKQRAFDLSLETYIRSLCSSSISKSHYNRDAFLLTYKQYCSTSQLVRCLINQFEAGAGSGGMNEDKKVRVKVINLIKRWFDESYGLHDLNEDPAAKELLSTFLLSPSCTSIHEIAGVVETIQNHILENHKWTRTHNRGSFSSAESSTTTPEQLLVQKQVRDSASAKPAHEKLQNMHIPLNLPHTIRETAVQLTLIEYNGFYKLIKPRELLGQAWTKKEIRESVSPNVVCMINLYNKRIRWVTSEILRYGRTIAERVAHVEAFIDIASLCISWGNFNTAFQITQGLTAPSIRKLHAVWNRVNKDQINRHEAAKILSSGDKNAARYRKELQRFAGKPCVPYLAAALKDLFNGEESVPTKNSDGSVNFGKFENLHKIISHFLSFQFYPYDKKSEHWKSDDLMQLNLSKVLERNMTDDMLFQAAKTYENEVAENFLDSLGDVGFI